MDPYLTFGFVAGAFALGALTLAWGIKIGARLVTETRSSALFGGDVIIPEIEQ